jgi:CHRD domain
MRTQALLLGATAVLAAALIAPSGASAGTLLTSHLTGKQIVNPSGGDPAGSATVILKVNRQKARICWTLNYKKLTGIRGMFLHKGGPGQIARPIVTFFTGSQPNGAHGCAKNLKKRIVKRLKRKGGNHYLDITTSKYPNGAVRGQLSRG